jgi:ribonuclease HII
VSTVYRVGADENGLGGQLGPLIVTAVSAEVSEAGTRFLSRRLPKAVRQDLNDSKALVSSHDTRLGESWCRALLDRQDAKASQTVAALTSPAQLLSKLLLTPERTLRAQCPKQNEAQCWSTDGESFEGEETELERVRGHIELLRARGVELRSVRSEVICTKLLNANKRVGVHRFMTDLHAMEALLIALRAEAKAPILAICGKIGGMGTYGRFFGPLSTELCNVLVEGRAESRYRFPKLGEVRFVRDADAKDPLVMLASLVGKYVRELYMKRITSFYPAEREQAAPAGHPSGYHDPVTQKFVGLTAKARRRLEVVDDCFLRLRDEGPAGSPEAPRRRAPKIRDESQGSLF